MHGTYRIILITVLISKQTGQILSAQFVFYPINDTYPQFYFGDYQKSLSLIPLPSIIVASSILHILSFQISELLAPYHCILTTKTYANLYNILDSGTQKLGIIFLVVDLCQSFLSKSCQIRFFISCKLKLVDKSWHGFYVRQQHDVKSS